MFHIFLAVFSITICYIRGDWKNWLNYYPTILFFILNSVVYNLLTYNHPLWLYESGILNCTFSDLLIAITVYPSTVMIFIPNFPRKVSKILLHISIYVALYTSTEFIANKLGYFTYHNSWSIGYSFIFNYSLFSILILHYKKPLYAWIMALMFPFILFYIMKIPYSSIR